jgi:hypothetical protein
MTDRAWPATVPWQAWVCVAAGVLAIAVGTVARGFLGSEWFFTADNVADSLPLALPFLVAAGVMLGVNRWADGRRWLVVGAWLLALHGVLDVALELQLASIMSDPATVAASEPLLVARSLLNWASHALGFGALAAGLWRSSAGDWRRLTRWAAAIVALMIGIAVAGLFAVNLAVAASLLTPPVVAVVVLGGAGFAAAGALAIAALRAAPRSGAIPELLIAAGAGIYGLNRGFAWALFGILPPDSGLLRLAYTDIGDGALLALAIGFGSGAFFGRPDDDEVTA